MINPFVQIAKCISLAGSVTVMQVPGSSGLFPKFFSTA